MIAWWVVVVVERLLAVFNWFPQSIEGIVGVIDADIAQQVFIFVNFWLDLAVAIVKACLVIIIHPLVVRFLS